MKLLYLQALFRWTLERLCRYHEHMFDLDSVQAALVTARQAMAAAARLVVAEPLCGAAAIDVLAQVDEIRRHVELVTVLATERVDRTGAFADDGSKSTKAFLRKACGESDGWAARQVRIGRALADRMPHTRAAWADGTIGAVHADVIRSAIKDLDDARAAQIERALADAAPDISLTDLCALAELIRQQNVPDEAAERDRQRFDRQHLTLVKTMDGQYDLRGRLNAENGALVSAILDSFMARVAAGGAVADPSRSDILKPAPGLRRALALVDMATQAAGHAEHCDASKAGGRPTIIVGVDLHTLAGGLGTGRLEDGTIIAGTVAQRLACDAQLIYASIKDGEILDLGRKTRTPSTALRAYLIARDGGCLFDGCQSRPGSCEAHHIIWWANDGATDRDNMILLCLYHHQLIHNHGWTIIGNARSPSLHFRSPDGRTTIPARRHPLIPKPRQTPAPDRLRL
jgi:hypothetical protein